MPSFWNGKWLGQTQILTPNLSAKHRPHPVSTVAWWKFSSFNVEIHLSVWFHQFSTFNSMCQSVNRYCTIWDLIPSFIFATMWHPFQGPGIYYMYVRNASKLGTSKKNCRHAELVDCRCGDLHTDALWSLLCTHDATWHMKWYCWWTKSCTTWDG